jgi:hypothetical protein
MNAKTAGDANNILQASNGEITGAYEKRMSNCFNGYDDVNEFFVCVNKIADRMEPLMKENGYRSQWMLNRYVTCVQSGNTGCIGELKTGLTGITSKIIDELYE